MSAAIVCRFQHHGNTKKLLDAIHTADPSVERIDVTAAAIADLTGFNRIPQRFFHQPKLSRVRLDGYGSSL